MENISFRDHSLYEIDFLNRGAVQYDFLSEGIARPPLSTEYAKELATASSVLNTKNAESRSDIENNLLYSGNDGRVDAAVEEAAKQLNAMKSEDLINNGTPEDISRYMPELLKDKKPNPSALIAASAIKLTGNSQENSEESLTDRFDSLTSWITQQRQLNEVLSDYQSRVQENTSTTKAVLDFAAALVPFYSPVAERSQRADSTDGGVLDFLYRSGATDEIAKKVLEAPQDKQIEILLLALEAIENSETLIGTNNVLYTYGLLDDLRNKLNDGASQIDKFSAANAISEAFGAFDIFEVKSAISGIKFLFNKAIGKSSVSSAVEGALQTRTNKGSLLDAMGREDQDELMRYLSQFEGFKDTGRRTKDGKPILSQSSISEEFSRLGNTVDEVIDRVMPAPKGKLDSLGLKGDWLEYDASILYSDLERKAISGNVIRRLEKAAGNKAEARLELSETFPPSSEGSLGGLTVRLGSKNENAFTYEEALSASHNMVGSEVKLVKREGNTFVPAKDGDKEVFMEVNQEIFFDPKRDAGVNELAFGTVGGIRNNKYLLNPFRRYNADIMKAYFGHKSISRGIQTQISQKLDIVRKLSNREGDLFNDLVRKGDADGVVFTRDAAREALDGDMPDSVWNAYTAFREVQDIDFRIKNRDHRLRLDQDGFKYLEKESEFVKPILNPRVKTRPDRNPNTVYGKAYDVETGSIIDLNQKFVDDLYNSGGIIVKSRGKKVIGEERYNQLIVRNRSSVTALPEFTLSRRKGYYSRYYADTGYLGVRRSRTLINGVEESIEEVTSIFPDLNSATAFKNASGDDSLEIVFSREANKFLQDVGGVSEFGIQPINQRKRGEQLLGPEGNPARTLDPMEAMSKQYTNIERTLNRNYTELMRNRWLKQYSPLLKNEYKGTFPSEFTNEIFDPRQLRKVENTINRAGRDVFEEAKSWFDHIRVAEGARDAPLFANFNRKISLHIERLVAEGKSATAPKILDWALSKADLKQIATTFYIVGRPLFQIPTNLLQLSYLAIRNPISGTVSAAQTIPMGMALLTRNTKSWKGVSKGLAKAFRMPQPEFERLVDGFMNSGLYNPKLSDDFLRYARESYRDSAATMRQSALRKYGRPLTTAVNVSRNAQSVSIMYSNMGGYIQAYKEAKKALGRAPTTAKERSRILAEADRLLQTQNGIDEFAFQHRNNPVSFFMQFMQHVTKLYYDMILDPTLKLTIGKSIGKNPSKFAETRAQAAKTLLGVTGVYGLQGLVGEDSGTDATDNLRIFFADNGITVPDEVWDFFRAGTLDVLINSFIDGQVSITGRITPAGVVDSVFGHMLQDPFSLEWMGAGGSLVDSFSNAGKAVMAFTSNPSLTTGEKILSSLPELTRLIVGVDDAYKAYIAYNTGIALSGTDLPIANVTKDQALLRAFSFRSMEEVYSNMERADRFSRQEKVQTLGNVYVSWIQNKLANSQGLPEAEQARLVREEWLPVVYAGAGEGLGDDVVTYVKARMLGQRDLLGNRWEQALQHTTYEQALKQLKLLKDRGVGDEKHTQYLIEQLQMMIDTKLGEE